MDTRWPGAPRRVLSASIWVGPIADTLALRCALGSFTDAAGLPWDQPLPFGVETGEPARLTGIFHPAGSELTVSRAMRSNIDAFGVSFDGKAGASRSSFSWAA